ncbi:MAG: N-acetylmuramoyl-L-alanine amidase-like domain-containing protein [Candidatus Neomarinimicrobiota bacterium]
MSRKTPLILSVLVLVILAGCTKRLPELDASDIAAADTLGIEKTYLQELLAKPLYEFSEKDIDTYLPYLQYTVPELQERIKHLARKGLGQKYNIYLLGEYPAEIYDDQPLFDLRESDCVVFTEHILAMAMGHDWQSFFSILQRIRYKDGVISYITRNHFSEYDWGPNNSWLADDITDEIAGEYAKLDTILVNKGNFFKRREVPYHMPIDSIVWKYIPMEVMPMMLDKLETGDIVNVVRGYQSNRWIGHFGLVMKDDDGSVYFLHSTHPEVIQQSFTEVIDNINASNLEKMEYNAPLELINLEIKTYNEEHPDDPRKYERLKTYTLGYRFLRVKDDPLAEIMKDGQELRLQVVPITMPAQKSSKADSVLNALK